MQISTHKAKGLGNDDRKTMINVKTIGQMLPFKNGTALPSSSQAPCSPFFICIASMAFLLSVSTDSSGQRSLCHFV